MSAAQPAGSHIATIQPYDMEREVEELVANAQE
jgi:hypothetical protein